MRAVIRCVLILVLRAASRVHSHTLCAHSTRAAAQLLSPEGLPFMLGASGVMWCAIQIMFAIREGEGASDKGF